MFRCYLIRGMHQHSCMLYRTTHNTPAAQCGQRLVLTETLSTSPAVDNVFYDDTYSERRDNDGNESGVGATSFYDDSCENNNLHSPKDQWGENTKV